MQQYITKNLQTFVLHFVKQFKWQFFAMACFRMCFVLDNLVIPYAFKVLVGRLTELADDRAGAWVKLSWPLFFLFLVMLCIDVSFRLFDYIKAKTLPAFEVKIRLWIVRYLQGHSYSFFTENFAGDLGKRVNDLTDGISQLVIMTLSSFLPTFVTMVMGIVSFSHIQPAFGVVLIIWLILHIATYIVYLKKYNHYTAFHAGKVSLLTGSIVDGFSNILSIKLFARKNQTIAHLIGPQKIEQKAHEKALMVIMYLHFVISALSIGFMGVGFVFYLIRYWQLGELTIDEVIYVFYAGSNICNLVWASVADFPDFFEEVGYCQQALKLLQQGHAVLDAPNANTLICKSSNIVFKDVCFAYIPGRPIFQKQNVFIKQGEKVGLVGLSGSGKSTFVNLLLRFFNIDGGTIMIDGQDISTVTQESLRNNIALIPQDTTLFHSSILENIRYGRKEATDEEVIACAKKAKCHDFIIGLPEGYHTFVGESGSKLSGGQRQRIAIARAMLKNAPILILDEATSALDAITEMEIQESLSHVMADKTTIVIAHRLAVLSAMDRVLVFDNGKIIADGPHEMLLATSPLYISMCKIQSEGMESFA